MTRKRRQAARPEAHVSKGEHATGLYLFVTSMLHVLIFFVAEAMLAATDTLVGVK